MMPQVIEALKNKGINIAQCRNFLYLGDNS